MTLPGENTQPDGEFLDHIEQGDEREQNQQ